MTISRSPASRRRRGVAIALLLALLSIRPEPGSRAHAATASTGSPTDVVLVTAGEHGDFSRVVFALGADLTYRSVPEPAGLRVVFPGARMEFEYGEVYPGRRAHRVIMAETGSDADGASFRLRFGCDCSVRTFMLDDRLVVDVLDAASSDSQSALSSGAPPAAGAGTSPASGETAADPVASESLARANDRGEPRPEFLQRVESLGGTAPDARPDVLPDGTSFDPDHLERMIAWAVDQGHLTEVAGSDGRAPRPGAPEDAPLATGAVAPGPAKPSPPTEQPELPVAMEAAVAPEPSVAEQEPAAESAAGDSCPDGAALDMAALGGTGTLAAELALRQEALSRALAAGHGVPEAQHHLAGFYLARMMQHEALQVLRTADRQGRTPTVSWLEAAAMVLADRARAPEVRGLLASSCPGADIELWRAVLRAADGPISRQVLESEAIPLRLAAYPPALRVELALRLAEAGIHAEARATRHRGGRARRRGQSEWWSTSCRRSGATRASCRRGRKAPTSGAPSPWL